MTASGTPRFLITTADERSWRTDRPILFLGKWCCEYTRRSEWAGLDAALVPEYGWDEGQQDTDFAYVQRLYEELLIELSEALNRYHGTGRSLRYWRILLGPWLLTFTSILFNRWATIRLAVRNFEISGSVLLELPVGQTIPSDFNDFAQKYLSHTWNHAIYGRILSGWTSVPCERIAVQEAAEGVPARASIPAPTLRRRLRRMGARGLSALARILSRPTDAFFINTYLPPKQDFRLQLGLGQLPKRWQIVTAPRIAPDFQVRRQIRLASTSHQGFEQCIRTLVLEQIPALYLEGYRSLLKAVAEVPWPKRPSVIFTSNNFQADDVFKAWAADKTEYGIPYVIGQHGGYYGTAKYSTQADLNEVATADRHLTWGWTDDNPKNYPAVALKIVGVPRGTWNPAGGLLLVTSLDLRYTRDPWDISAQTASYMEDQFRFVAALPQTIRAVLTVRLHFAAASHGNPHDVLWRARHPDVRLDPGTSPIEPLIRRSRLFVYTVNSTAFLETLGRNIPTIIFWDPKYNGLRPSAQPYFDLLKKAGIFHETPESAAAKVAEVWNDVTGWWNRPEVRGACVKFCDRFARMPENPIQVLKNALTTVKAGQHA